MNAVIAVIIAFVAVLFGGIGVPLLVNWLFDKFGW